jgi:RNA polymerase sigma factor (sigma-70 family)
MKSTELEAQLERLHPESFGWALSCCGRNQMEAEDVLQTAYLKVVSGEARFGGRSSFKTWLFGVIRRTAQEASRKVRARERRILRLVPDGAEAVADPGNVGESIALEQSRAERTRRLVQALEKLSDRQQEVLHLVFYQDLTIAQAAKVMGTSLGSARTHYERGKARLRDLLQEDMLRDA